MSQLDKLYKEFRPYASLLQSEDPQSIVGLIIYDDGSGLVEITNYRFRSEYTEIIRVHPVKFASISEGVKRLEELNVRREARQERD